MTSSLLTMAWFQLLALLAAEVGLTALGVALLRLWSPSAAWRRTFCQAGITAALVITVCELSGSARMLGGWAASTLNWRKAGGLPGPSQAIPAQPPGVPQSMGEMRGRATGESGAEQRTTFYPAAVLTARTPWTAVPTLADGAVDAMGELWLCLVWAVGATLTGGRACLAQCLFMILQRRRRPVAERALVERVRALAKALGIGRRVRVVESARLTSPIAFGLIRPTVGLPPDFSGRFDPAKQDAMLAHELAHLAAQDPFWCLLADVATVVLWWHPGVWWLRRQLHLVSEMAADEASLLVADGPRVLAECLVELGTRMTQQVLLRQLRVAGFRSHLGRRVQQLVHLEGRAWSPPPRLGAAMVRIFGPMVMTIIVVLCTAWAAPQALAKGDGMKMIRQNWKQSLATFALLAAFNGPEATLAVAQTDKPEPPPPPAPDATPAAPSAPADSATKPAAIETPSTPKPASPPTDAADAFRKRYGLTLGPPDRYPVEIYTNQAQAEEGFRRRYGLDARPVPAAAGKPARQQEKPVRGGKIEAKLKQIVLPEVTFDNLPLGEVLRVLSDETVKRDPDKTGVNFLINPNFRPVALTGAVDPATGLPLAAQMEQFDVAAVAVKFNLPLRNVTMKDLLDAIVTVADRPIEYVLEDYAVVFSAKPETVAGQAVVMNHSGMPPEPSQRFTIRPNSLPMVAEPAYRPHGKVPSPNRAHVPDPALADAKPQIFNIDFGTGPSSEQVGPAVAGRTGDFWNCVTIGFNDHHTASELKFAGGDPSPIEAELINLGGAWSSSGTMGVKSPMLDNYSYPTGNKGGNSRVILYHVPAGKYTVYIYGHGPNPIYYGDYTLTVGTRNYGRKQTSRKMDAIRNTKWVEGSQYVKFSNVKVGEGEEIEILIQPGGEVTDPSGRTFADAMICGLQLVPLK